MDVGTFCVLSGGAADGRAAGASMACPETSALGPGLRLMSCAVWLLLLLVVVPLVRGTALLNAVDCGTQLLWTSAVVRCRVDGRLLVIRSLLMSGSLLLECWVWVPTALVVGECWSRYAVSSLCRDSEYSSDRKRIN